ncbi:MAG: PSD1 and planctomycete cytochrome C domain-containing protein [bacterium]|nr:PSD1 and planctomycete cytochrome C domain-containing protein [bacterium]
MTGPRHGANITPVMTMSSRQALAPVLAVLTMAAAGALLTVAVSAQTAPDRRATSDQGAAPAVRFGRDIRPILSDKCFRCHGPDAGTRAADLRLDVRAAAVADRDGGAAIVPGNPEESLLWHRVTATDSGERMPPPESQKPALTAAELALVRTWIAAGAPYEEHWSFTPPQRPAVPATGTDWARNPIDQFVRAELARRGLSPNPEASAETLARRAFLVLTGLPPTPDELAGFLADERPDAFDRLVDRLLDAEPYRTRHAEHFAGPWLDAARYADTCGIHMDAGRQIWPWRDWLLRALADDKPFNEFVVEQLAGDLIPEATAAQRVATGFLRSHVTTDEGGAIDQEYLVEYAAERTATVGSVFLGLTVGCARCHDHKFDPISQRDYFGLFAYFYNNDEPGLYRQSRNVNRALEPFLEVPSAAQLAERERLTQELAAAEADLVTEDPAEADQRAAFFADLERASGIAWPEVTLLSATSAGGATMRQQPDGSVLVSGVNPEQDTHELVLHAGAGELRLLCLEAIPDASLPAGKVGRSANGNVVLGAVEIAARPAGSREEWRTIPLAWAIADVEQENGDFRVVNALANNGRGWAVAAHTTEPSRRRALFLADTSFGDARGTEIRVRLHYDSIHDRHVFGRFRLHVGTIAEPMLARLPVATSGIYKTAPFAGTRESLYDEAHGPETSPRIDLAGRWGKRRWRHDDKLRFGTVHALSNKLGATFVGHEVYAPTPRRLTAHLGSDDGFQVHVGGKQVGERRVDRGVAADQDTIEFEVARGPQAVVLEIINTGGAAGFYWRHEEGSEVLDGAMRHWLFPAATRDAALVARLEDAWRARYSPGYAARKARIATAEAALKELESATPRTMVMSERTERRPTFVLMRGEYDKPDESQPMQPQLPAMFGVAAETGPRDRLALARWLVSDDNPLLHRVAVNRLFEFVFGTGIVRTSEDFGLQGEWPSHPELLDWLVLEFRARGTSMREMLRMLVKSATFRQDSRRNLAAAAQDGDNRLLAWFPRRRLTAEAIRDQALYTSGLLVERVGGPSVKPYQPAGLWREVAMVQSNTRNFVRDDGEALWRRSLYTYWKRACPPPTLLTFDAPTREFCTIRRSTTNTPLQALALWNDEQFVESARALAQRTLAHPGDDRARLRQMHRRCTGHDLDGVRLDRALATLQQLRRRYHAAPADAEALLAAGDSPRDPTIPAPEHAAYLLLANAFLNLDATLYID